MCCRGSFTLCCSSSLSGVNEYMAIDHGACMRSFTLRCSDLLSFMNGHLAIDRGGCLRLNSIRVLIATLVNTFIEI